MLKLSEIFYSLQGESQFQGYPCIFIRLSGCNLNCTWCDTTYSFEGGKPMSFDEILAEVEAYPARLVEITGGEPLCQPEAIGLMRLLLERGYSVLLETNGSMPIKEVPDEIIKIVDVKCPLSTCGDSFLKENLEYLSPKDELKFVLAGRADYDFACKFLEENIIPVNTVHFSPVTASLKPETLAEWMLADGVKAKLALQLHKILGIS